LNLEKAQGGRLPEREVEYWSEKMIILWNKLWHVFHILKTLKKGLLI